MYYKCKTSAQLQVTLGGPTLSWSCTLVVFLAFPLSDRLLEFTFIALLHEGERERERERESSNLGGKEWIERWKNKTRIHYTTNEHKVMKANAFRMEWGELRIQCKSWKPGRERKRRKIKISHFSLLSLSLSFFLYPRITWSFHQQDPSPEKVRSFLEWQSKDTYIMISRIPAA
jgi:hypothetical protein